MNQYDGSYTGGAKKQTSADDEKAGNLIKEWQYLQTRRGNWNAHWTEIAQRIIPMDSWLFQNFNMLSSQGDKRNFELYDSTGLVALERFGSILDSLLTPRDQIWHILKPADPMLKKDKATRMWFEKVNTILWDRRYSTNANFASQNQNQYISLGAYGTGVMFTDDLAGSPGIRYKGVSLSECYLSENHQGLVDTNCRHFMMTARQAYQRFGDKCPEQITSSMDQSPENPFYFLHWVKPRTDRDPVRKDFKGMEFESTYISIAGSQIVEEGGYRTFPYAISRYYQCTNEAYGRSIAMNLLPALKTLNEQKKTMLKQGHRAVDPVLLAHDDGIIDGFSLTPGAINPGGVSADGRLLVQALPVGSVQAGKDFMDEERKLINDSFLINLFQILTENPQQTATEVLERTREKGILLAPTIGRQSSEYLGPLIHRELDILSKQGLLPPMPPMLKSAKDHYAIDYDSPISRTAKAEASAGASRTFETLVQVAQATGDPSVLDIINMDVAGYAIAENNAVPYSWMRTPQDIQNIRNQRAKQQAQQQAVDAAPAAAGIMKAHAAMGAKVSGG